MEKFKKRVSAILVIGIIAFVAGFAMLSQNLSHVSRVSAAENVASLSVDGTVTEYATVKDALDAIPAESEVETTIVKILQDTTVSLSNMSNKKFTLDLNGCKLTNTSQFLNNSEILFVDNSDSGTGEFYSHSQNSLDITNCNITIKSGKISADYNESSKKTYPSCTILSGSKVTVDGGRLEMSVKADVETGILIMNSGYIYEMFYQDSTFHNNVTLNGGNIKALQEADKDIIDSIATINKTIDGLRKEFDSVKKELQDSIDKKADAETVNEKLGQLDETVKKLEKAIGTAESASNGYADKLDAAIRKDIETLKGNIAEDILNAKNSAIAAAGEALTDAKKELNDKIAEKADKTELQNAVNDFNTALTNAESVSKKYSDDKTEGLRKDLEAEIAKAKGELSASIDDLLKRLETAEKNIDGNSKQISALKATVITVVSLFFAIDVLFAVLFFVFKRRVL